MRTSLCALGLLLIAPFSRAQQTQHITYALESESNGSATYYTAQYSVPVVLPLSSNWNCITDPPSNGVGAGFICTSNSPGNFASVSIAATCTATKTVDSQFLSLYSEVNGKPVYIGKLIAACVYK